MSRMIDRLLRAGIDSHDADIIVVDDAANYFLTSLYTTNVSPDNFSVTDFPRSLSPWKRAFVEFRLAASERREYEQSPYSVGLFAYSANKKERESTPNFPNSMLGMQQSAIRQFSGLTKEVFWMTTFVLYLETEKNELHGPLTDWTVSYSESGALISGNEKWPLVVGGYLVNRHVSIEEQQGFSQRMMASYLYPVLFALSLANCKNISASIVHPPEKLSRAHQKRYGKPLLRYYTLNIDPMKKVLRDEGQVESLGLKKALHICRGHFADYTEGKGLFGKYHGQYWVPQHVKGSASRGIVEKDYAVKAPGEVGR